MDGDWVSNQIELLYSDPRKFWCTFGSADFMFQLMRAYETAQKKSSEEGAWYLRSKHSLFYVLNKGFEVCFDSEDELVKSGMGVFARIFDTHMSRAYFVITERGQRNFIRKYKQERC